MCWHGFCISTLRNRKVMTKSKFFSIITLILVAACLCQLFHQQDKKKIPKKDRIDAAMKQEWLMVHNPQTQEIPRRQLLKIKNGMNTAKRGNSGLVWSERGPNNVGGRTRALMFDKGDATHETVFAAGVSGGLWKTTGISSTFPNWQPIDDFLGNLSICAIAQHPTLHNTIYFGTGEGYFANNATPGMGLWKSVDGGTSWSHLASTNNTDFDYVQDIVIDNSGNIFVSTLDGVKKSTNGGASWTSILDQNHFAVTNKANNLELASDGTLYATMGVLCEDGIYKSTNGGSTWTKLTTGLPSSDYNRIQIAVAPSDPNRIYVLFEDEATSACKGIYKSTNAGSSWSSVTNPAALGMTNFARKQAWYDLTISVDPNNPNRLFIGGIDLLISSNSGGSWDQVTQWGGLGGIQYMHADQHAIVFAPGESDKVVFGNDGGVYFTNDGSAVEPQIFAKNNGFNVTQFYACTAHPSSGNNEYLAGAQDNGTQRFLSPGVNTTEEASGGDGARCYIDKDSPDIQISSYVFNNYFISTNGGTSFNYIPLNDNGLFANANDYDHSRNYLYAAAAPGKIIRWTNPTTGGNSYSTVTLSGLGGQQVSYVKVSPSVADRVYIGTTVGDIYKVDNAHMGSTKAASRIRNASTGYVSSIVIDESNENHILISYSNYGLDNIYQTTNGGSSWTSVEGNLPDMPVRDITFHPESTDKAFIATEIGVWSTDNMNGSSTNWQADNSGLANVRVDMLHIRESDNMMLAATHGRGLYTTTSLGSVKANFTSLGLTKSESSNSGSIGTCNENYTTYNIEVTLTAPVSLPSTVLVSVDNALSNMTSGRDYTLTGTSLSFTPGGSLSKSASLKIIDDAIDEANEVLTLKMLSSQVKIGDADKMTIVISDDDEDPVLSGGSSEIEIGNGTTSDDNYPFRGFYEDERTQMIIRAEELLSAGLVAGDIKDMSLHIMSKASSSPFKGFSVKMMHTSLNEVNHIGDPFESGAQVVYSADLSTIDGWNKVVFTSSFYWNGVDNLLIDICFNNKNWSDDDELYCTSTGYNSVQYRYADGSTGCNLTTVMKVTDKRPDMRFGQDPQKLKLPSGQASKSTYVAGNETAHFYDEGELVMSVENLSSSDISCMEVSIDRAGPGVLSPSWLGGYNVSEKTFYIDAYSDVSYRVTLYYKSSELSAWGNPDGLNLIKTNSPISSYQNDGYDILTNGNIIITDLPSGFKSFAGEFYGFSGFGLTDQPQSTVPAEIIDMSVSHRNGKNRIRWTTASELGVLRYFIQRSFDAQFYEEVGSKSAEHSQETSLYYFDDKDIEFNNKRYYYRLRIEDLDGAETMTEWRSVYVSGDGDSIIEIFPNPVRGTATVELINPGDEIVEIRIFGQSGKILNTITNTGDIRIEIDMSNLEPSTYIMKYVLASGGQGSRRFIKVN